MCERGSVTPGGHRVPVSRRQVRGRRSLGWAADHVESVDHRKMLIGLFGPSSIPMAKTSTRLLTPSARCRIYAASLQEAGWEGGL